MTWAGLSWIKPQLALSSPNKTFLYTWARQLDDEVTKNAQYRQFTPHFGNSALARKVSLGLAAGQERLYRGMTKSAISTMQKDNIHLVHAHFGRAGYYALPIIEKTHTPLITSFYGYDVAKYPVKYPKWRGYYQALFKKLDYAICLGKVMQENIIALGCPPEKAVINHLGVNTQGIRYEPRQWEAGQPLKILMASSFREKKGIPFALEALGKFRHEYPIELTIIGDAQADSNSAAEKQRILAAIKTFDLEGVTRLLGNQPYHAMLEEAYKNHIFILPSITAHDGDMEGTPMALVDMASTGIMIISTKHSDIPEIIQHEKTGLLAEERDPDGILQHLQWYARNPNLWETFSREGRAHVEREFDQQKQVQRLQLLYASAIDQHKK